MEKKNEPGLTSVLFIVFRRKLVESPGLTLHLPITLYPMLPTMKNQRSFLQQTMNRLGSLAGQRSGLVLIASLLLLISSCANKQEVALFGYLSDQRIEAVDLQLDLSLVYGKDSVDFPGALRWLEADGRTTSIPITVSIRGNNRREVCDFPPLKIRIAPGDHPFKEGCYKLVSHCLAQEGESLLLREYLAYRLYEDLTPYSFGAHLMRVTYSDPEQERSEVESWMVLLESKDDLLDRLDAEEVDPEEEPLREISGPDYHRFAVFQYMIGNTDWNLNKGHNVKWVRPRKGGLPIPVPYDFDRSGLVNAPYAEPHYLLPIQTVRERFFQWRGHDRSQLAPILADFRARQDVLFGEIWDLEPLLITDRQDVVVYLEGFFLHMDELLSKGVRTAGNNWLQEHAG